MTTQATTRDPLESPAPGDLPAVPCVYCHGPVPPERVEYGYSHCKSAACGRMWQQQRLTDGNLALVLLPKQGFTYVYKSDVAGAGRSSGRT